jgi:hypothetical protein
MPIMFNTILLANGFAAGDVRLLRHKDRRAAKGQTPYEVWRDNLQQFELYQATQAIGNESKLSARYWASFVGAPSDQTLFVGIYAVGNRRLLEQDWRNSPGGWFFRPSHARRESAGRLRMTHSAGEEWRK